MAPLRISRMVWRPANCTRLACRRTFSTSSSRNILAARLPRGKTPLTWLPKKEQPKSRRKQITVYPNVPSARERCKEPLLALQQMQLKVLDPNGSRRRLFDRKNPESAKVGDILLVRLRDGDPYAGICMNIRRSGVETAILLRNTLTHVGTEMWYKVYSPNVEGIEVAQRRQKRARRARLYYLRQPRHDIGSVDKIVAAYIRRQQTLRGISSSSVKGRDANSHRKRFKTK